MQESIALHYDRIKTIGTIIRALYLASYTSHGLGYKQNRSQLTTTITSYIFCHLESNN